MKKADIKVGFLCNNNCFFCVQGHKKIFGNKTTREIKASIKEARKDCEIVVFTGGEPTIREDILELVSFAKNLKFKIIQIQSNGRMFAYKDFCQKIVNAGANEFALALHGHKADLHNYLTQQNSFLQVVKGINNLKKMNQSVIMNTVIVKSNYRYLPEITKLLIGLNVDQIQFAFVHALGAAKDNFDKVIPRISLVIPFLVKSLKLGTRFNKKIMVEAIPPCFLKDFQEHISENSMPEMKIFDLDNIVDNFKEARIVEGKMKNTKCKKCTLFSVCEGPWKEYPERFGWDEFKPVIK